MRSILTVLLLKPFVITKNLTSKNVYITTACFGVEHNFLLVKIEKYWSCQIPHSDRKLHPAMLCALDRVTQAPGKTVPT